MHPFSQGLEKCHFSTQFFISKTKHDKNLKKSQGRLNSKGIAQYFFFKNLDVFFTLLKNYFRANNFFSTPSHPGTALKKLPKYTHVKTRLLYFFHCRARGMRPSKIEKTAKNAFLRVLSLLLTKHASIDQKLIVSSRDPGANLN